MALPKRPNFSEYEPRLYKMWEEAGYFTPLRSAQGKLKDKSREGLVPSEAR